MANSHSALAQRPTHIQKLLALPVRHLQQAIGSLGDLWRTPFTTVMTIVVLGISLTLPATLHVFVKNAQAISHQWNSASQITLYLKLSTSDNAAQALVQRVGLYPEVDNVVFISPKQALREFSQSSGFGDALGYLDKNPLPATLLVTPTQRHSQSQAAQELLAKLQKEREVDIGQLDLEWLTSLKLRDSSSVKKFRDSDIFMDSYKKQLVSNYRVERKYSPDKLSNLTCKMNATR